MLLPHLLQNVSKNLNMIDPCVSSYMEWPLVVISGPGNLWKEHILPFILR